MHTIRTYPELHQAVRAWTRGHYNLLVVIGRPEGQGKSREVRDAVDESDEPTIWLQGTVSAFRLYQLIYENSHKSRLVIDDVDSFYRNRDLVRMLKCLCETEKTKTMAWHTGAKQFDSGDLPREYTVRMTTCIIGNDFRALDKNVGALEDRGRVFRFEPSPAEVYRQARTWFRDREILRFVEDRLHLLSGLSLRDFRRAREDKAAGMPWQRIFLEEKGVDDQEVVISELMSMAFLSEEARVQEYIRLTGRSRASYFRRKRAMRSRFS